MDIKLKNNHNLAVVIILVVILLPSVGMMWLCPYFNQEADNYKGKFMTNYEFLTKIVQGDYVLYVEEARKKAGQTVSPFELFYPNAKEAMADMIENQDMQAYEIVEEMQGNAYSRYQKWESEFAGVREYMNYQVLDENRSVMGGNSKDYLLDTLDNSYAFGAVIEFDAGGNVTVRSAYGKYAETIKSTLAQMSRNQPLGSYNDYADRYMNRYTSEYTADYLKNWNFQNPQNRTFVYAMTKEQMDRYLDEYQPWEYVNYLSNGSIPKAAGGFMVVVALAAFILPFIRCLRTGNEKIFRAPLEISLVATFIILTMDISMCQVKLVQLVNYGTVTDALKDMGFPGSLAYLLSQAWILLWWILMFASVYWCVSCLRGIVTIGFKRFFKERTFMYQIFSWVKRVIQRGYYSLEHFDFHDNGNKMIFKIVGINFLVLLIICSLWFFGIVALIIYSIALFFVLQKYFTDLQTKYQKLLISTNEIAEGNLDVTIEEDLGVFNPLKGELQRIQSGFKTAVNEEVKSQKLKTDLISNVSHDLKTPLTAIITYVNLLKNANISEEERESYINVLDKKSNRLKILIEDLFEVSKATSNNVTLDFMDVDVVDLLKQVRLELSDKIEASTLRFRWNLPNEKVILSLDSQKTYRVFENLLCNILNYSMENTRVYIDMETTQDEVIVSMKNISASELTFNPNEITERFVRGDAARNTEGSGLGLAIAKSFVELQNGNFMVLVDGDLFKVEIRWAYQSKESVGVQLIAAE